VALLVVDPGQNKSKKAYAEKGREQSVKANILEEGEKTNARESLGGGARRKGTKELRKRWGAIHVPKNREPGGRDRTNQGAARKVFEEGLARKIRILGRTGKSH